MNGFTVGDGFRFGCGFLLALLIAWLAMVLLSVIAAVILRALGIPVGPLFGFWQKVSELPMILGLI